MIENFIRRRKRMTLNMKWILFLILVCTTAGSLPTTSPSIRITHQTDVQEYLPSYQPTATYQPTAQLPPSSRPTAQVSPTFRPTILHGYQPTAFYLRLQPVVQTSHNILVGNIHDGIANSNACSTTALLSTCNLRSAWALCMSLIQAVICPSSADQALLVTCSIVLPASSSIAFNSSHGDAMNLSALSSWASSCNNTLVTLSIATTTTTSLIPVAKTNITGDGTSTSLLYLTGIPFVRFSMRNVAVMGFGDGSSAFPGAVVIDSLLGASFGPGVQFGPNNVGYATSGALAVYSLPSIRVKSSIFIGNTAVANYANGGALSIFYSESVFIAASTFVNNSNVGHGGYGGALFVQSSDNVTISDCKFFSNSNTGRYGYGGVLYLSAVNNVSFTHCDLTGNSNTGGNGAGGALFLTTVHNVSFAHCDLTGNSNTGGNGAGGALYLTTANNVSFTHCNLTGNSNTGGNGQGGALDLYFSSNVVVTGCNVMSNTNTGGNGIGGALHFYSSNKISIAHSSFASNVADDGGAIYIGLQSSFIGMTAVHFSRNVALSGAGGAVYVGASCSYISLGGPMPIHETCAGVCDQAKGVGYSNTMVREPTSLHVIGYYVVFNDVPSDVIPYNLHCQTTAIVGDYVYDVCSYQGYTTPGVNGEAPYFYRGSNMAVNFTRENVPSNGYVNLWVFPLSDLRSVFDGNVAATYGGAIYIGNSANNVFVMPGTVFTGNRVKGSGGAVFLGSLSTKVYFYSTVFSGNVALTNGGAVAFQNLVSSVHFYSCSFAFNSARLGGIVYLGTGNGNDLSNTGLINVIEFNNATMRHNNASLHGGGIYANNLNAFSLVSSLMSGNIAGRSGGAVSMNTANVMSITTNRTSFIQNSAGTNGGAIFSNATNTINSSDITGITTFSRNKCMGRGGAVAVNSGSIVSFNSTTIFDSNYAQHQGGALAVSASSLVLGTSAITFVNNSALSGSAMYLMSSTTSSVDLQKGSLILGSGCINKTTCTIPPGYIGRGYIIRAYYGRVGSSTGCNTAPLALYTHELGVCTSKYTGGNWGYWGNNGVYSLIPSAAGGFPQLFFENYGPITTGRKTRKQPPLLVYS